MVTTVRSEKPQIRQTIDACLQTDADLTAFCIDFFPKTASRFSDGMDRMAKVNLLLQLEHHEDIFERLKSESENDFRKPGKRKHRHFMVLYASIFSLLVALGMQLFFMCRFSKNTTNVNIKPENPVNVSSPLAADMSTSTNSDQSDPLQDMLIAQVSRKTAKIRKHDQHTDARQIKGKIAPSYRQDFIMHNTGPTQINNIAGSHGPISIMQNNE